MVLDLVISIVIVVVAVISFYIVFHIYNDGDNFVWRIIQIFVCTVIFYCLLTELYKIFSIILYIIGTTFVHITWYIIIYFQLQGYDIDTELVEFMLIIIILIISFLLRPK